jgi:hypothetical protein
MRVKNIHIREINAPKSEIAKLFRTLATDNDRVIPTEKWSSMKLDKGLQVGSKGGHGPIRYTIVDYQQDDSITFQFDLKGFDGFHKFEIVEKEPGRTTITHIVDTRTSGLATLKWHFAIRWLHNAYIEDTLDKVENNFLNDKKRTEWSWWVKKLRKLMKPPSK